MTLQLWIWLMIGITFSLYIGIAIWSKAGSTKEFYVAGAGVSPIANGMATRLVIIKSKKVSLPH